MTADDYPTVAAIDAHIGAERFQLQVYTRQRANLRGTERENRAAAVEIDDCIEVTRCIIDELLDLRLQKTAVAA